MSRVKYVKHLEQALEAMKRVTDDLTRENYELKKLLQIVASTSNKKRDNSLRVSR